MTPPSSGLRILVIAHGHPDFSLGGGELAAYQLFQAYRQHPDVAQASLLARAEDPAGWPSGAISLRREDEYLWYQAVHEREAFASVERTSLFGALADLVQTLKPDVVHAHHFHHLGLDHLVALRRLLPRARIFLTLHDYMAICRHDGQMVRPGSLALCERASLHDCQRCYPERSLGEHWLRRERLRAVLGLLDGFVAPSHFLRQRYIDWGVPAERITTIDNGQAPRPRLAPRSLAAEPVENLADAPSMPPAQVRRNRFGYFGQVNAFKGLDVLLHALTLLEAPERAGVQLDVNAAHLEHQPPELRERIAGYLARLEPTGVVRWRGAYRPAEMTQRLADIDWVVVPSVWWENSPLVIQEAFAAGRPVVCSDIGGMAEKVRHGVDGWHVPVGNPSAWAQALGHLARTPGLWQRLADGLPAVMGCAAAAQAHLAWFAQPRGTPAPWGAPSSWG